MSWDLVATVRRVADGLQKESDIMPSMTERKKIGRPSKGDRVVSWTRLPRADRERAEELALQSGQPVSDAVAALVAVGLRHLDEVSLPMKTLAEQGELPLVRAS